MLHTYSFLLPYWPPNGTIDGLCQQRHLYEMTASLGTHEDCSRRNEMLNLHLILNNYYAEGERD